LRNGIGKIADFENGIFGFVDLEIDNGVNRDGNVIFGDDFLFGNIESVDPDVNFDNSLENGND